MKKIEKLHLEERNSKWLRQRISIPTIFKSVSSLIEDPKSKKNNNRYEEEKIVLPDTIKEELKNNRFIVSKNPEKEKIKIHNINPENLFTKTTLQKIIKLRNIFLEFDEDGSKKLELNELETMFMKNNIPVTLDELVKLFFPNKTFHKDEEPYLDFYQLYLFAIDDNNDNKFRIFMREIKKKIEEKRKKDTLSYLFNNNVVSSNNNSLAPSQSNSRKPSIFMFNSNEKKDANEIKEKEKDKDLVSSCKFYF